MKLYTAEELDYLACGCRLNTRKQPCMPYSFDMDVSKSVELASLLPADVIKVSEGGIDTPVIAKQVSRSRISGHHHR